MTQNISGYTLPLTDAQKAAIHRQARRAQAEAFAAFGSAIVARLRRLVARRPVGAIGSQAPGGPHAAGRAG